MFINEMVNSVHRFTGGEGVNSAGILNSIGVTTLWIVIFSSFKIKHAAHYISIESSTNGLYKAGTFISIAFNL